MLFRSEVESLDGKRHESESDRGGGVAGSDPNIGHASVNQVGYLKVAARTENGCFWQVERQSGLPEAAFEEALGACAGFPDYDSQPTVHEVVNTADRPRVAIWDDESGLPACEGDQRNWERTCRTSYVRNVCLTRRIVDKVDPGDVDASSGQRFQSAATRLREPHKATGPGLSVETVRQNSNRQGTSGHRDVFARGSFGPGEPELAWGVSFGNSI